MLLVVTTVILRSVCRSKTEALKLKSVNLYDLVKKID